MEIKLTWDTFFAVGHLIVTLHIAKKLWHIDKFSAVWVLIFGIDYSIKRYFGIR